MSIYSIEETENSIKCSISVTTTNIADFCVAIHLLEIRDKIYEFVSNKLQEYGTEQAIEDVYISEMIKNSCDSFVSNQPLKIGTNLEILVNIKYMDDAVIVKFKDNGNGLVLNCKDKERKFFDVPFVVKQSSSKSYRFKFSN